MRILIVEDERALRDTLVRFLATRGHEVQGVADGEQGVAALRRTSVGILLSDIRLPGALDGIGLLRAVKEVSPETRVLLMTAFASVDTAVQALREGAFDYLLKPLILEDLASKVAHIIRYAQLSQECVRLRQELQKRHDFENIVGASRVMTEVFRLVDKVASSPSSVLITGESGTGKELVARAIHHRGLTKEANFLAVNVAAIPRDLAESQLFGHEKGAFTGAERRREGLLRSASGGTVFLDEVGELPLELQAKLLRALEEKEVYPVGADAPVRIAVRIIAATHRDLEQMAREGRFRTDLYYRLNVLRVHLPPLRERVEDIPPLVLHFLALHAHELGRPRPRIDDVAMGLLMAYDWKGNVRELSNVLERAVLLCEGSVIGVADLPGDMVGSGAPAPVGLKEAVAELLRRHVARALHEAGGNRERAAQLLGISEATLYRKMDQCGLKGVRG